MNEFNLPKDFLGQKAKQQLAFVHPYRADKSTIKNRVVLTTHLFSFLTEGSKEIIMGDEKIRFDTSQFALVTAGKCFMSEKISDRNNYASTLLFFEHELLQSFFITHQAKINTILKKEKIKPKEILLFKNDAFTKSFTQTLTLLSKHSEDLIKLKLQEVLLYLLETQPLELCCLFAQNTTSSEYITFKNIIDSHIDSNLSVEELAYLCNVSLSTFKRKFTAIYNDSPTNWIRKKRMEHAAFLLKYNKERPSDIYMRLGYENFSSFTQSFKSIFGSTPKEYQMQD
jgi:AraC family transcriptional regulator, exoenzyme S synthesis regulatory protein ExsA